MKNITQKCLMSVLLMSAFACGGSGGNNSSAPVAPETTVPVVPETPEVADLVVQNINTQGGLEGRETTEFSLLADSLILDFQINHETNIVTANFNGEEIEGEYDPDNNELIFTFEEEGETDVDIIPLSDFDEYQFSYTALHEEGIAIGVQATDASALPTVNNVTYHGSFTSNVGSGNAITTANFNSGLVDAEFVGNSGEIDGATLELNDMVIDDQGFAGGTNTVTSADGNVGLYEGNVSGGFYGPNGEEVAGSIYLENEDDDTDYIEGSWIGAR